MHRTRVDLDVSVGADRKAGAAQPRVHYIRGQGEAAIHGHQRQRPQLGNRHYSTPIGIARRGSVTSVSASSGCRRMQADVFASYADGDLLFAIEFGWSFGPDDAGADSNGDPVAAPRAHF